MQVVQVRQPVDENERKLYERYPNERSVCALFIIINWLFSDSKIFVQSFIIYLFDTVYRCALDP